MWKILRKIWRNTTQEVCEKYEKIENMKKCVRNMKEYPYYISSGSWKNSVLSSSIQLLGLEIPHLPFLYSTWDSNNFEAFPPCIGSGTWKSSELFLYIGSGTQKGLFPVFMRCSTSKLFLNLSHSEQLYSGDFSGVHELLIQALNLCTISCRYVFFKFSVTKTIFFSRCSISSCELLLSYISHQ